MGQVSLKGIHKRYGAVEVIKGIDLDVRDGEFLVFVGPSGCGKSTMLRMIAGLEDITAGDLLIDGQRANEVRPADRGAAMVFQSYALYPHMTVAENMGFALRMAGVARAERDAQVRRAAEVLRITELLDRLPKELSGGQRQRVAIGRAIVRKPKVFLFDEPLSNLDAELRVSMRIELSRLHQELGTTMIYVTHDQVEAMTLADRIVLLRPLEGREDQPSVAQAGAPLDLYHHPANRFVAGFIGSPAMNFIDARVAALGDAAVQLTVHGMSLQAEVSTAGLALHDAVTLGIRPEHVQIGQGPHRARVSHLERLGEFCHVYLDLPGAATPLLAKSARDDIAVGDQLPFALPAAQLHLFRADGLAQARLPDLPYHVS